MLKIVTCHIKLTHLHKWITSKLKLVLLLLWCDQNSIAPPSLLTSHVRLNTFQGSLFSFPHRREFLSPKKRRPSRNKKRPARWGGGARGPKQPQQLLLLSFLLLCTGVESLFSLAAALRKLLYPHILLCQLLLAHFFHDNRYMGVLRFTGFWPWNKISNLWVQDQRLFFIQLFASFHLSMIFAYSFVNE